MMSGLGISLPSWYWVLEMKFFKVQDITYFAIIDWHCNGSLGSNFLYYEWAMLSSGISFPFGFCLFATVVEMKLVPGTMNSQQASMDSYMACC